MLREPTRRERLEAETELFGYAVSQHLLELFEDVAWEIYFPVARLGEHIGETTVTCGLVVEQRTHDQITGEPMKFLTLAEGVGFEPTVALPLRLISSQVPLTTQPPFHCT